MYLYTPLPQICDYRIPVPSHSYTALTFPCSSTWYNSFHAETNCKKVGGGPSKKALEVYSEFVESINSLEAEYEALSDEQLTGKTEEFRGRLEKGESLDDILPEAYAAVREASKRTIGMRHYDIQLIGGLILHQGKVAEMRTGKEKRWRRPSRCTSTA